MLKNILGTLIIFCVLQVHAQTQDAKSDSYRMKTYVDALMKKMTLDEKIGQLNLLTPGGGVATGAVVSSDVETKIKAGNVGGLFGVIGVDKIKQAQQLAVNNSRLHIPLFFGSDIIHGYKTTFPIPLGLSCSWDTALIRRSAAVAASEATADGLNWAFPPWLILPVIPAGGGLQRGQVKILSWALQLQRLW